MNSSRFMVNTFDSVADHKRILKYPHHDHLHLKYKTPPLNKLKAL